MGGQTMSPEAIYDAFHKNAPGSASLDIATRAALETQRMHPELCDMIRALTTKMDAAWQGNASTAAQSAANPLVQTAAQSGDELYGAQQAMAHQSSAYTVARHSIQEMPAEPGFWSRINPFGDAMTTDMKRMAIGLGNTAAYSGYVSASNTNQAAMPQQYGALNADASNVQVAPPPPPNPGNTGYGGYNGRTGSYSRSQTGGGSYSGGGHSQPQPIPGGGGQPTTPTPQPYGPGGDVPIGNDPVGFRPGDPGYIPGPASPGSPGYNSGPGGPGFSDGPGGGYLGGGFGPGGTAGGSGGRFGSSAGVGAGEGEDGFGGRGPGARSGFGPKGPDGGNSFGPGGAGETAMGRGGSGMGAAGRPGSPGAAGGMGMGAGRGGHSDDDEHHSASYLQDDYSGEIVGDLGMTAPPVIGE